MLFFAYNTNVKVIAAIISIIGSFAYLHISGANIAASRAFIMTSIFIVSTIWGRSPYPLRSVMIAAFLILLFLPEYVLHPSFQLSFAAVLCLISGYEFYMKNKSILGNSKGIIASIKLYIFANIYSSFLASIMTAPYVIYHFYSYQKETHKRKQWKRATVKVHLISQRLLYPIYRHIVQGPAGYS